MQKLRHALESVLNARDSFVCPTSGGRACGLAYRTPAEVATTWEDEQTRLNTRPEPSTPPGEQATLALAERLDQAAKGT